MLRASARDYSGKLIMISKQMTEHRGDEEVHLYKVILEINDYETITLERVRSNEINIYGYGGGEDIYDPDKF